MRRFSIAGLMAVVLVVAVAVTALRDASDTWAGALLLLTLALLASAVLGIIHRRDAKRAFWQGFALFGWGYLVLAQAPYFDEKLSPRLPTTHLLGYAHAKLNPAPQAVPYKVLVDNIALLSGSTATDGSGPIALTPPAGTPWASTANVQVSPPAIPLPRTFTWTLGSAGNLDQFRRVGHCLFALAAALAGAAVSRWFHRGGRAGPATA